MVSAVVTTVMAMFITMVTAMMAMFITVVTAVMTAVMSAVMAMFIAVVTTVMTALDVDNLRLHMHLLLARVHHWLLPHRLPIHWLSHSGHRLAHDRLARDWLAFCGL